MCIITFKKIIFSMKRMEYLRVFMSGNAFKNYSQYEKKIQGFLGNIEKCVWFVGILFESV